MSSPLAGMKDGIRICSKNIYYNKQLHSHHHQWYNALKQRCGTQSYDGDVYSSKRLTSILLYCNTNEDSFIAIERIRLQSCSALSYSKVPVTIPHVCTQSQRAGLLLI